MRGDLSTRYRGPDSNFNGVLFQQGRVFLDRDGNAQTAITTEWEDLAARDVIGAGVAAIPGDEADSFQVVSAVPHPDGAQLTVNPGRVWADGMLVQLDGHPPIQRQANYLQPPIQDPPFDDSTIADGVRDAVVLEVWRHEVHGFQLPDVLIEEALGGVDTTERLATGFDFKLFRLGDGDTCESIGGQISDDPNAKGKLTVTLQPTVVTAGDCPTVEGGGYTGFEHNLFRIEIAATDAGPAMFKWSRFNGGLVGRGTADVGSTKLTIQANLTAIATSDLTDFYLEVVECDANLGRWAVTFGTEASLVDDELQFTGAPVFGAATPPAAGATVFFRLWNEIRAIGDFPAGGANPTELVDGIRLELEPDASGKYVPEDYWTFQVRADGMPNANPLIDSEPPEGIVYHRVPLAVLEWDGSERVTVADGTIEDCRRVFQPLTRLGNCCTYTVGDGLVSHGQFTSIQAAINALPTDGGKVCVLPGTFLEPVLIEGRTNVTVSGCGRRTRVEVPPGSGDPVFNVRGSQAIRLEHMAVYADEDGIGVLLEGGGIDLEVEVVPRALDVLGGVVDHRAAAADGELDGDVMRPVHRRPGLLEDVVLEDLFVRAATRSGIECREGREISILGCTIWMADQASSWPGIFFVARNGLIEDNTVVVVSREIPPTPDREFTARGGLGGIQLGGLCYDVAVRENVIQCGVGNGITLGSITVLDDSGNDSGDLVGWVVNADDPCNPCRPGDTSLPPGDGGGSRYVSAGPLWDIVIEDNRILDMGLSGIGVIAFFDLEVEETISVFGLRIVENEIRRCLKRELAQIGRRFVGSMGYGGIALADVSQLEIRSNIIDSNGPDYLEPVCGVFVLHGEVVEVVHNRITNNGVRTDEPTSGAKPGPRGGIYIAYCAPSVIGTLVPIKMMVLRSPDPSAGNPSLRVHDNVVTVPLGRALTATTLGDVSVHGNHFTSLGVVQRERGTVQAPAATVQIIDSGFSSFMGDGVQYRSIALGTYQENLKQTTDNSVLVESTAVDRGFRFLGGDGRILFTDNQVALRVDREPPIHVRTQALEIKEQAVSGRASIVISSLGDVAFDDNQCSVVLAAGLLLTNVYLLATTVRANDNWLSEGLPNAIYSGVTLGQINTTTDNQSVHCLLVRAWTGLLVDQPNLVVVDSTSSRRCEFYDELLSSFGTVRQRFGSDTGEVQQA